MQANRARNYTVRPTKAGSVLLTVTASNGTGIAATLEVTVEVTATHRTAASWVPRLTRHGDVDTTTFGYLYDRIYYSESISLEIIRPMHPLIDQPTQDRADASPRQGKDHERRRHVADQCDARRKNHWAARMFVERPTTSTRHRGGSRARYPQSVFRPATVAWQLANNCWPIDPRACLSRSIHTAHLQKQFDLTTEDHQTIEHILTIRVAAALANSQPELFQRSALRPGRDRDQKPDPRTILPINLIGSEAMSSAKPESPSRGLFTESSLTSGQLVSRKAQPVSEYGASNQSKIERSY